MKPALTLELQAGHPKVKWNKSGMQGLDLYVDRFTALHLALAEADSATSTSLSSSFKDSLPTPVITSVASQIYNVRPSSDGSLLLADLDVSGTVLSSICDITPGEVGAITNIFVYVNGFADPSETNGTPVLVTKGTNYGSFTAPYPYSGTFSRTFYGVEVDVGTNIIRVTATEQITGVSGYAELAGVVTATPITTPVDHGLPVLYGNTRVALDFGAGVHSLADFGTNGTANFSFEILTNNHPGLAANNVTYSGTLAPVLGLTNGLMILTNAQAWVIINDTNQLDTFLHADTRGVGLSVVVGVPWLAPPNILYELQESGTNTGRFTNDFVALAAQFTSQPTNKVVDSTAVAFYRLGGLLQTNTLTETTTNSFLFSGSSGTVTLQLPGQPSWKTNLIDTLSVTFTAHSVALTNYALNTFESDTNSFAFATDEELWLTEGVGDFFGSTYSGGNCIVTAASDSGLLNLHFAQFQGPAGVLAELASQSNGTIVQGSDGQYYLANSDQQPAAILGLDGVPHGAINCNGTVLGGFVTGVAGGIKAFVWDGWYELGTHVANKYVLPAIDLGFDLYSVATGTMKLEDVAETLRARVKEKFPVAEALGSYVLGQLGNTNGDFQTFAAGFVETGAKACSADFQKQSDQVQQALVLGANLLAGLWDDLKNGCPERRAQIIGRATFEVVTIYTAFAKVGQVVRAGEVAKMTEAEMLIQMAQESSVPEVRQAAQRLLATARVRNFYPFTKSYYRKNLAILTGINPKTAHAHHMFVQKFEAKFAELGINIHDPKYLAWWEKKAHLAAVRPYQAAWEQFFRELPSIPASERLERALNLGRNLAQEYGLTIHF